MKSKKPSLGKVIIILICLLGLLWGLDKRGALDWLRRPIERLINPLQKEVYQTILNKDERAVLEREKASLEAKIGELEKENQRLRKLMGSPLPPDWQFILGQVVGREEETLILDVGSDQGVKIGQAVVTENHLVGQIIEVKPRRSRLCLITHPDSNVPAMISDSVVFGKAKGNGGSVMLEEVLTKYNLAKTQLVVTSGESGWPRGLIIGKIGEIDKQESAIYQQASLNLLWHTEELDVVFGIEE